MRKAKVETKKMLQPSDAPIWVCNNTKATTNLFFSSSPQKKHWNQLVLPFSQEGCIYNGDITLYSSSNWKFSIKRITEINGHFTISCIRDAALIKEFNRELPGHKTSQETSLLRKLLWLPVSREQTPTERTIGLRWQGKLLTKFSRNTWWHDLNNIWLCDSSTAEHLYVQ